MLPCAKPALDPLDDGIVALEHQRALALCGCAHQVGARLASNGEPIPSHDGGLAVNARREHDDASRFGVVDGAL